MGLVDYSESEGSDQEEKPVEKPQKPAAKTGKPTFQKVVDRSNPGKIQINLPELPTEPPKENKEEDGPPAKKARIGGGAFSGFNSFLPAPKRSATTDGGLNGAKRGGLGSGVNLKTGSAPGFSREPAIDFAPSVGEATDNNDRDNTYSEDGVSMEYSTTENGGVLNLPLPKSTSAASEEPKKQGNPMMFKPLSVARKPQKKKAPPHTNGEVTPKSNDSPITAKPTAPPKVSLFSAEPLQEYNNTNDGTSGGTYEPLLYNTHKSPEISSGNDPAEPSNPYIFTDSQPLNDTPEAPQSLITIASDLNLSASAKRQLFGRQAHKNPSSTSPHNNNNSNIQILNFSTDAEYAANELLRQSGELQQAVQNPVRAIAPGKHSLKQLVNAASNQKDALEEQFASGRRNRKEAGGRYGW